MTSVFFYTTLAFVFVIMVAGPPIVLIRLSHLQPKNRNRGLAALGLIAATTVVGILYMEVTLRHLAVQAAEPIHGLIGRPIPNGGGDHDYTPRGREYETVAFRQPFYFVAVSLVGIAVIFSGIAPHDRLTLVLSWLAALLGIAAVFMFWVVREFTAWDIFI